MAGSPTGKPETEAETYAMSHWSCSAETPVGGSRHRAGCYSCEKRAGGRPNKAGFQGFEVMIIIMRR